MIQAQFYTGSYQTFGKNRLQYEQFKWEYYKFDKFNTYFYGSTDRLAIYASEIANRNIIEFEFFFNYILDSKIFLMLFNTQNHWKQTNIGLKEKIEQNIGGVTKVEKNKLFIYFEGNHLKLEQQIRKGLLRIFIEQIIQGDVIKDQIKNSILIDFPEWFLEGMISYLSDPESIFTNDILKDGLFNKKFTNINLPNNKEEARLFGHMIWYYLVDLYGPNMIKDILMNIKIYKEIDLAFYLTYGKSLKEIVKKTILFFKKNIEISQMNLKLPYGKPLKLRVRKDRIYQNVKVNPKLNKIAFVSNKKGQYKVWIGDMNSKKNLKKNKFKTKKILKKEHKLDRIPDLSFPLIQWHPFLEKLYLIYENKSEIQLSNYDLKSKKWEEFPIRRVDKVYSFQFSENGKKIVFSALADNQVDLYEFNVLTKSISRITNDIYDDLNPFYINENEILFSSNRFNEEEKSDKDTILKQIKLSFDTVNNQFDLVKLNVDKKEFVHYTNTKFENETNPLKLNETEFITLTKRNKLNVKKEHIQIDSIISSIDTTIHYRYNATKTLVSEFKRNILYHDIDTLNKKFMDIIFNKKKYQFYYYLIDSTLKINDTNLINNNIGEEYVTSNVSFHKNNNNSLIITSKNHTKSTKNFIEQYKFENKNEVIKKNIKKELKKENKNQIKKSKDLTFINFDKNKKRLYNLSFFPTNITTQTDFDFATSFYQPYSPGAGGYNNAGVGEIFKVGIFDLFEDYLIEGRFRLSFTGDNELQFSINNRKKRLDKKISFQRRITKKRNIAVKTNQITHQANISFKWPFNEVLAIKTTFNFRNDKTLTLGTDIPSLRVPNVSKNWLGSKAEFIFDNTIDKATNIKNGIRFKIFSEIYVELGQAKSDMLILGLDFRAYQKIHKNMIWAFRFAASTNVGNRRLVYYLGAVDNWIYINNPSEKFNTSTPIDQNQNYYFQTLATSFRGVNQNTRNGNSFALINSEIRCPIFSYLYRTPIKSKFFKNFQLVGFSDIGSAWIGLHPFSKDNITTQSTMNFGPIRVILKNENYPIVASYGYGFRTIIYGYFVRFDYAYAYINFIKQTPLLQISLNLDF